MAPTDRTTPKLHPEILADGEATAARIDQLLRPDGQYRQHTRAIVNAQRALRGVLSQREWRAYMDLETVVNARFTYTLTMLVRWAFAQGREHPACTRR